MKKTVLYPLLALAAGFTMLGTALVIAQDPGMPGMPGDAQSPGDEAPAAAEAPGAPQPAEAPADTPPSEEVTAETTQAAATEEATETEAFTPEELGGEVIIPEEEEGVEEFVEMPEEEIIIPEQEERMVSETISITLDDVEMVDVVRMFTRVSGANIIATPSQLVGRVTVNLTDVGWKPAMDSILDMHSLQLTEKIPGSGVYSITRRQPGAPEPMVVETIFLSYATVGMVEPVIRNMLASGGSISTFPSRNAMVLRSTTANLEQIKQIVENIDIQQQQVFIEAKFLELNDEAIKNLGVNWQMLQGYTIGAGNFNWSFDEQKSWSDSRNDGLTQGDNRTRTDAINERYDILGQQYEESTTTIEESPPGSGNFVANTVVTPTRTLSDSLNMTRNVTANISKDFTRTFTEARSAVLGADDFRLVLSALRQMNGVSVVSNPKIIVANEEEAIIHIGTRERPFVSQVNQATPESAPVVTYNPGEPVDIGVKLSVTPTVNTLSNITVRIAPELTRLVGNATAPNGQTYPIIGTKTIQTSFCLENKETVAIGGLTETTQNKNETKVPLLGDIPLIGKWLFSHVSDRKQQQETIIFVTLGLATPNNIKQQDGLPEDTELVRRHMLKKRAERYEYQRTMDELEAAAEAKIAEQEASRLEE